MKSRKKLAFFAVFCFVLMLCPVSAHAMIQVTGDQSVTISVDTGNPQQWYSFIVTAGTKNAYSLDSESIQYLNQFQTNDDGCLNVTFIHATLPQCVFLTGGDFAGGLASPLIIGTYTPEPVNQGNTLPDDLKVIEAEAFAGCPFEIVLLGTAVKSIGPRAFQDCVSLTRIEIPDNVTSIADDAFEGCSFLTIACREGSTAYTFAQEHDLTIDVMN